MHLPYLRLRKLHAMSRRIPLQIPVLLPLLAVCVLIVLSLRASEHALETQRVAEAAIKQAEAEVHLNAQISEARKLVPSCARPRLNRRGRASSFVLLFMGHSGSTALISALQQHNEVLVSGFEPLDHGDMKTNTDAALQYAESFFAAGAVGNRTAGFKIRPHHILQQPKRWAELFREHGTRIIWNYRSNIFKQAVGHWPIAYLNDTTAYEGIRVGANSKKKRSGVRRYKISDPAAFHRLLSARWRGERDVERALAMLGDDACVLPISYELLLRDPTKAYFAMQSLLGLSIDPNIRARRSKVTSDNLCQVVTNWDDICRDFFLCSRWRPMMDDVENGCTCPVPTGVLHSGWRKFCEPEVVRTPAEQDSNPLHSTKVSHKQSTHADAGSSDSHSAR